MDRSRTEQSGKNLERPINTRHRSQRRGLLGYLDAGPGRAHTRQGPRQPRPQGPGGRQHRAVYRQKPARFIVREPETEDNIGWGEVNHPIEKDVYEALYQRVTDHLAERELYTQDVYAGPDTQYRLAIGAITPSPWHAHFCRNMFRLPRTYQHDDSIEPFMPDFTIVHAPEFEAVPERDGTRSEVFVIISFEHKVLLIGGSTYMGEMKKSVFSVMNYLLPKAVYSACTPRPISDRQAVPRDLWTMRNRQDDAGHGSQQKDDRRRRDRLGCRWNLQHRGRVVRQIDQPQSGR